MNKIMHGGIDIKYIECINSRLQKYRVRWDFQLHYDEEGEQEGVTYYEHEFAFKPSLKQIKLVLLKIQYIIHLKQLKNYLNLLH